MHIIGTPETNAIIERDFDPEQIKQLISNVASGLNGVTAQR